MADFPVTEWYSAVAFCTAVAKSALTPSSPAAEDFAVDAPGAGSPNKSLNQPPDLPPP